MHADVKAAPANFPAGPFIYCDVLSQETIARTVVEHKIDWVIHLASLLSAVGERNPQVLAYTIALDYSTCFVYNRH
jgi:threonine 3-dehydrogenase